MARVVYGWLPYAVLGLNVNKHESRLQDYPEKLLLAGKKKEMPDEKIAGQHRLGVVEGLRKSLSSGLVGYFAAKRLIQHYTLV